MVDIGHIILIPNSNPIKYNPTIKENIVFLDWLKSRNIYDEFIKIADLCVLSQEKIPEYYFTCLDWDDIDNDYYRNNSKKYKVDWDFISCEWLKYISIRDWNFISTGVSP